MECMRAQTGEDANAPDEQNNHDQAKSGAG
jgi:hypothetical protein